jgi:hypothetical protein
MRKSSSLRRNRHAAISTAMAKNEDSIPKQMLDVCGGREERRIIKEFMGDKVLGPVVLWFENYRISLSGLNVPKDGKVPMLDPDRVSKYGLETIYLVNCSSEGNFYATTNSAQQIHGAVYCHQMADVIATIQDICKREQVVIVGANECYEDDMLMVKNGLVMLFFIITPVHIMDLSPLLNGKIKQAQGAGTPGRNDAADECRHKHKKIT